MAYCYAPMQNTNSIRLLHLGSGCGNSSLEAHFASCRLEDRCCYEALSYVWGEPILAELLLVDDQEFKISKNLHTILLHLRYPDKTRILWIDAICINQQDGVEKGEQVALMGQIYQQAETVLCWLGELLMHRLWALEFLQVLAEEALRYIEPDRVEYYWTFLSDKLVPRVNVNLVVEAALEAHVEAIYESDWFTRIWVVQELALARNPRILCGTYDLSWQEFELATRVIAHCLRNIGPSPKNLRSIEGAWDIISLRGEYSLNMTAISDRRVLVRLDLPWTIGRLAWDMRRRKCQDDKDRVYALLSLTGSGNEIFVPEAFIPDYTRPVEWAYHQFWRRFGGYTSLFYAGLSRRRVYSKTNGNEVVNEDSSVYFKDNYLPSWVPDLRPCHTKEWKPIFGPNYAASTPFHHMDVKFKEGLPILMLRGHRFDVVVRGFHATRQIEPCQKLEDFVNLRFTINFFLSLRSKYEPYPSGQPWIEALGAALMTGMPSEDSEDHHPFQKYLDSFHLKTSLSKSKLRRIWKLYLEKLLADTGDVWTKFCSVALSRKQFSFGPLVELTHDGQLVWMLHKYLGDVLQAHRLIITGRGYMGLAPPDTERGDVIAAFGGPGVPFVVRDTAFEITGKLVADGTNARVVPDENGRIVSQLLGPCYLQGIMNAELWEEERHKTDFGWETDALGTIPKPTLCLI